MGACKVQDLEVWQRAMDLTEAVYKVSDTLPRSQMFVLANQMQRAAVSIPGNIAEGFLRSGWRDKARFYNIARASAEELRTYLLLTKRLGYPETPASVMDLLDRVGAMLHRLWEAVQTAHR